MTDREGRVSDADDVYTCERCGKVRPRDWTCECGGEGRGDKAGTELAGWDPAATQTSRPRLRLVQRPTPPDQPA
jgi:hypothetical protein